MPRVRLSSVFKVCKWEFFKGAKSPMFIVMTLVIPLIMLASGFAGFLGERAATESAMRIAVLDQTNGFFDFLLDARSNDNVEYSLFTGTEQELNALVRDGSFEGYYIISEDNLKSNVIPMVVKDIREINQNQLTRMLEQATSFYRLSLLGVARSDIALATGSIGMDVREISGEGDAREVSMFNIMVPLAVAMVLIMASLLSGQVLMYGVLKEKKNRIVEILLSSISSTELLLGKMVGTGILCLLQILIWVGAGIFSATILWDISALQLGLGDFAPVLVIFFLGFFLLAALYAALGATMKDAEESGQAQGLLVLIPILPLFTASLIMHTPNALWARVVSHIPPFIPTMTLLRMAVTDLPLWEMGTITISLILSIALFVKIGARIFEKGILQYDRSFTLKDLFGVGKKG